MYVEYVQGVPKKSSFALTIPRTIGYRKLSFSDSKISFSAIKTRFVTVKYHL
jgi:hypothetical protein